MNLAPAHESKPYRLWGINGKFTKRKGEKRRQGERKIKEDYNRNKAKKSNKDFAKEIFTVNLFSLLFYNINDAYS